MLSLNLSRCTVVALLLQGLLLYQLVTPAQAQETDHVHLAGELKRIVVHGPYVECVFTKMERELQAIPLPWERAQRWTQKGTYDGFFMAAKNKTRDQYATLSEPFFSIEWLYVVRKASQIKPSDKDFYNNTFSAVQGSARLKWLSALFDTKDGPGKIIVSHNSEETLTALRNGRIDVSLENDKNLVKAFINTGLPPSEFKTFIIKTTPVGVYFSNNFLEAEPTFLKRFNSFVEACR